MKNKQTINNMFKHFLTESVYNQEEQYFSNKDFDNNNYQISKHKPPIHDKNDLKLQLRTIKKGKIVTFRVTKKKLF